MTNATATQSLMAVAPGGQTVELVPASDLAMAEGFIRDIEALEITDTASYQKASELLNQVTSMLTKSKTSRLARVKPFNEFVVFVREKIEAALDKPLEVAKVQIAAKATAYMKVQEAKRLAEEQRIARERAEAARLKADAEAKLLAAKRAEEERVRREKAEADEAARRAALALDTVEDTPEAQESAAQALEDAARAQREADQLTPQFTETVLAATEEVQAAQDMQMDASAQRPETVVKVKGLKTKKTPIIERVDLKAAPEWALQVNEVAVKKAILAGVLSSKDAWLSFRIEETLAGTGR